MFNFLLTGSEPLFASPKGIPRYNVAPGDESALHKGLFSHYATQHGES